MNFNYHSSIGFTHSSSEGGHCNEAVSNWGYRKVPYLGILGKGLSHDIVTPVLGTLALALRAWCSSGFNVDP